MARTRVGTVAYLNAAPLTHLLDPERFEVIARHPRGIAAALASGEVDVALAPVAAALTDGDYRILPGVCIGADGPVHSVVIVAETPPSAWTEVVLDGSSRTSQTLARLLLTEGPLSEQVSAGLVISEGAPGDGPRRVGGTVAALVIGDPARELPDHLQRWDLSALWKAWTGQPFVFAVWAARPDLDPAVAAELVAAGKRGVEAISTTWTGEDLIYLTEHIRYQLDDPALIGLRRYAALAHRAGLVGTEDVQIMGPAHTSRPRQPALDEVLARVVDGAVLGPDEAQALLDARRDAELGIAAQLVRSARFGRKASYLVEHDVPAEVVAQGGDAFVAAVAKASDADASVVRLHGLGALSGAQQRQRLGVVRAAGLQAVGLDLSEGAHDVAALAQAGLTALDWTVGAHPVPVPSELPVHAHIVVDVHTRGDLVARLDVIRRAWAETGRVLSVTVHLPLPDGALVQPGLPTPSAWLRAVSLTRLYLPEVHVCASPSSQGVDACQAALFVGADDFGALGGGPFPSTPGVARFEVSRAEAERALRVVGLEVARRDAAFAELGGAVTELRRIRPVAERAALP